MEYHMNSYIKKNILNFIFVFLFALVVVISYYLDFKPIIQITEENFLDFISEMFSFLPLLFILIGLFDVWVPKEIVTKNFGNDSGIKGVILAILLAMVQAGPLYASFPVAYILWKKGGSIRNIYIYIGAFSSFKIPLLTFEISFLGFKFSMLRSIFSIPIFIIIGIIMEKLLKNNNFEVKDVR